MDVGIDAEKTNPFEPGVDNPGADKTVGEDIELINLNPYDSSSRRGSVDPTGHHRTYEETSFGGVTSETEPLLGRMKSVDSALKNIEAAWNEIKKKYPKINPLKAPFTARIDQNGRIIVKYNRLGGKYLLLLNADGELNEKLPMTIKKFLGPPAEQHVETLKSEITKLQAEIDDFNKRKTDETLSEGQKQTIDHQINEREVRVTELEREVEEIDQRMTLRDRVKTIFRKYGFTVLAVASAIGLVIGVIVANLKNGLTSLGKGVSNGLKTIGKKLGEILPRLVGDIASFVFRTAGEVVGFLAKNAWLLLVSLFI